MDYEGYHYIVTEEFNHKKREVKDVKVTLYNPKGEVVKQEQPSKSTRKVEQGTPAYAVYTLIWGGQISDPPRIMIFGESHIRTFSFEGVFFYYL